MSLKSNPDGTLRLCYGAKTLDRVTVVLCRPLFSPDQCAVVFSEKWQELGIIKNLQRLSRTSRRVLDLAKKRYYLTHRILKVKSISHQFGAVYWEVETDKGYRECVIKGVSEHVRWLSDYRLLIKDVDGNRFEITDLRVLDRKSQNLIDLIL